MWRGRKGHTGTGLTFTSQMLMPPSMPVVQNWEHLAFPPVSTEIWLQRGQGLDGSWPVSCWTGARLPSRSSHPSGAAVSSETRRGVLLGCLAESPGGGL